MHAYKINKAFSSNEQSQENLTAKNFHIFSKYYMKYLKFPLIRMYVHASLHQYDNTYL